MTTSNNNNTIEVKNHIQARFKERLHRDNLSLKMGVAGYTIKPDHVAQHITIPVNDINNRPEPIEFPPHEDLKSWRHIMPAVVPDYPDLTRQTIISTGCICDLPVTESFRTFAGSDTKLINTEFYGTAFKGHVDMFIHDVTPPHYQNGDLCLVSIEYSQQVMSYYEPNTGYAKIVPFLDGVLIASLQVFKEQQGKGHGSRILEIMKSRADESGTKIYLLPGILNDSEHRLSVPKLYAWYIRHDFMKTLPLHIPVTRLSHFKGGDTTITKSGYLVYAPREPKGEVALAA
jgi:hypothetical protein